MLANVTPILFNKDIKIKNLKYINLNAKVHDFYENKIQIF